MLQSFVKKFSSLQSNFLNCSSNSFSSGLVILVNDSYEDVDGTFDDVDGTIDDVDADRTFDDVDADDLALFFSLLIVDSSSESFTINNYLFSDIILYIMNIIYILVIFY